MRPYKIFTFALSFQKIIYFSDGAASQYKNFKNFINLCHHEKDFGCRAEWHFFATSHGKGPCDGIRGTVKRMATKASLQRLYQDQIMTPWQLYNFAKDKVEKISFHFSTVADHEKEQENLEERFSHGKTISGTQKFHSFIPESSSTINVKYYSSSSESKVVVVSDKEEIPFEQIKGFVTAVYDRKWWLACVLQTFPDTEMVKLSFLHPSGTAPSFSFPQGRQDILEVPASDILSIVSPQCPRGRVYHLSKTEEGQASKTLGLQQ